jgi:ribosomal peptide maturation radical SAM protein 1
MAEPAQVVFVSMPFAPIYAPSLALGLLKASLEGISSHTCYFGFDFADRIGVPLYQRIAHHGIPDSLLVGEWIFQPALFPEAAQQESAFIEQLLRPVILAEEIEQLIAARRIAADFVEKCASQVLEHHPRIAAFTDVFQQNTATLALARLLKQANPDIFVLLGGANCEGPMGPELIRCFCFVDAAVSGEADQIFAPLVRDILERRPIPATPGVYTQAAAKIGNGPGSTAPVSNLNHLPYPDFDDFFSQFSEFSGAKHLRARVPMETSRGCWWGQVHHCTFCGLNGENMGFRSKSASRALAEVEHLASRYPGRSFMLTDNILDLVYFRDFLPELARRRLPVRLFYEIKANLKKSQLKLLRDAGVTQIQPGIESFSDAILAIMRKGVRGLQNVQLLKWCKQVGVLPLWHFLWGFPEEPPEEYARMAKIVPLLTHLEPPRGAGAIRLDRFSPNYERGNDLGFKNIRPAAAYGYIYPFSEAALRKLAYYFDYDYQDSRDVDAYTAPLRAAIDEWRQVHQQSELFAEDTGHDLLIWDLRPVAVRSFVRLDGLARTIYLACDEIRSVSSLVRLGAAAEVEDALASFGRDGLILRDDNSVLALAVMRDSAQPSADERADSQ